MSENVASEKVKVRTGIRYRKKRLADHYDAIVVGSGIGGLTTAALLSLLGKKVCVLEQHYTAGGYTHAYEREGYEWDVGVHYIGEVHKPSTMKRMFDVLSQSRLKWAAMDPVYDRIIIADKEYDFVAGRENFINSLSEQFPEERANIERYVALIREMSSQTPKFFAGQAMPKWMTAIYNNVRPWLVRKEFFQSTREVLEGLTTNQELISVLTGQWGDYGQPPRDAAFLMHALIAKHYLAGGAYPVGGASEMARSIIPTIQQSGGEVFTYAEVEEVLVKDNKAYGVKMAKGDEIHAEVVISNIGIHKTLGKLYPEASRKQHNITATLNHKALNHSSSSYCLYAGFKGDAKELELDTTNLWIYPNGDHEGNIDAFREGKHRDFPLLYMSFPSSKDPQWSERFPGKSTVEIVTIANFEDYQPWEGTYWRQRGEDYEARKENLSQQLLEKLFERKPQLRDALDYYELGTPLSTQFYQHNNAGEIYGVDHWVDRFKQPCLHPQTDVKNLYMTGSDVMTAGVGGALMGGVMCTMRVLGLRKGGEVMKLFKNYVEPS
ncbi:phytoene desaturase family protein [Pseudoteredinibacter isoporae]|uniref:All-trans-retinol 13,14-reductase n=1 Tax=Pseudoteredinibacter isoporae TaxID=570281 RepID=A0A7X0MXQ1_9GAMM|nr:NAD(P)/FAD-dependent oxidoreductase [Pseudoteredinibacter isoporae]MBB6522229.1 all-trans-retinol 13,14-reductase [Pseudoteredinibacter isoporae]NHO87763.1 NAD(P)/FAD-dependent oxidoreductase [Pseudoteredinibacter isoporae]NIB23906.1 NAD(P)/FAD-dependent oxidoreductase [Pseudoteredinibacter isoporae]